MGNSPPYWPGEPNEQVQSLFSCPAHSSSRRAGRPGPPLTAGQSVGRRQEAAMAAVTTHHRTGSAEALDTAIELFADLVQHCPEDHPSRAMYESNLAGCLLV